MPDLSNAWLPLEREGKPVGVRSKDIAIAYFDDAPERADFIPGFAKALLWLLQTRFPYDRLVDGLRAQLGTRAITFTREAEVSTGFVRNTASRIHLLKWLKVQFPDRAVLTDLGCLIA